MVETLARIALLSRRSGASDGSNMPSSLYAAHTHEREGGGESEGRKGRKEGPSHLLGL